MKKALKLLVIFSVFFVLSSFVSGVKLLSYNITGKVYFEDIPYPHTRGLLPGANVVVYKMNTPILGSVSNVNGEYSLTVPDNATSIRFIYLGCDTVVVPLSGSSNRTIDATIYFPE